MTDLEKRALGVELDRLIGDDVGGIRAEALAITRGEALAVSAAERVIGRCDVLAGSLHVIVAALQQAQPEPQGLDAAVDAALEAVVAEGETVRYYVEASMLDDPTTRRLLADEVVRSAILAALPHLRGQVPEVKAYPLWRAIHAESEKSGYPCNVGLADVVAALDSLSAAPACRRFEEATNA